MSFSVEEFQKLKRHLSEGTLGIGFSLNPRIDIHISDNTSYGRGWEVRIIEEASRRMCILTEQDGNLSEDYRELIPLPNGGYDFRPLVDRDFEQQAQVLFAETVVSLERKRADAIEAARRATEWLGTLARDESAMQRWRELVRLLAFLPAHAQKIEKAVSPAFAAPDRFLKRLRLEHVTSDVPWLALIAALRKHKLLAEFDWSEDLDELTAGLDELCARSGHPSLDWGTLAEETDGSAAACLNASSRALEANGLALVCLVTGSDSFPTALIPRTSFEPAAAHAATFGWRIERHFA